MNSEKIKLYLVIALALVAAVVAYFRFIHKRTEPVTPATVAGTPSPQTQFDLDPAKTAQSQRPRVSRPALTEPLRMDIRDIFAPLRMPPKPKPVVQPKPQVLSKPMEKAPVVAPPAPPLNVELKGTVVGGNEPLAIINDKFVRLGEKVGDYQVVGITPSAVYLESGKHRKVLQVISGAAK
ncbi:MAG: hypothetical protein P1P89_01600 [Desulfobacterales bacterium]|nr:hypothetical protein [Desulfobacterales bacterium]